MIFLLLVVFELFKTYPIQFLSMLLLFFLLNFCLLLILLLFDPIHYYSFRR